MTVQPRDHRLGAVQHQPGRNHRPVDQDHRNPQGSSRFQLGFGPRAAGILGDDMGDAVVLQQRQVAGFGEGTAGNDHLGIWQGQRPVGRIDQPQKVVVPGFRGEGGKRLLADRQEDPARWFGQSGDGGLKVGHPVPVVARPGLPGWPFQRAKRRAGFGAGGNGVAAHGGGEGVGRVDNMADPFGPKVIGQPPGAAKAADPGRQRLGQRRVGAPGIGKDRVDPGRRERARKRRGFGGSAQQKDAAHV